MTASAGQWITIHGHHILIKGAVLTPAHIDDIAAQTGLSPAATSALQNAHAQGQFHTDHQLHNAATQISGAVAVGFDEPHAIKDALAQFSKHSVTPSSSATGKTVVTPIWQAGKGKSTKTKAGAGGSHVDVVTHGAQLLPGETQDYAAKFGLNKEAAGLLEGAANIGVLHNDTHLAQTVGDAIHIHKMTGKGHAEAVLDLMNGKSATQVIADHQAPPASTVPSTPAPELSAGGKVPIQSVGPKNKADFAAIPDVHLPGESPLPPLKSGQTQSAGILIVEPDGKVWVFEPKGHFAGYEHTFSKGGVESGLSLQQSAHKELYEELGLTANITGVLGDFSTEGTATRYYIGVRTGGDPKDAENGLTQPGASETHAVKLVTPEDAAKMLNKVRDQQVLQALQNHLSTNGNPHQAAVTPAAMQPATVQLHDLLKKSGVHDFLVEQSVSGGLTDNAWDALGSELLDGKVKPNHLTEILNVAANMANDEGASQVNTGHIKKAIWMKKKGVIDPNHPSAAPAPIPTPVAPPVVSPVAPPSASPLSVVAPSLTAPASVSSTKPKKKTVASSSTKPVADHVTIQGKKFDVDHAKPVNVADVDELKGEVKVSTNGETALKKAVTDGAIQTHGQLIEKSAMAQAASLASGHTSVNNTGLTAVAAHPTVESLLDAAHNGDSSAKSIVAKLGPHSFESPAAKQSALDAAQKTALDAEFQGGTPEQHLGTKIGGKGGFNDGALYQMPGGAKNYVKTVASPGVAHNEHLANAIYNALGLSAPNSKVFDHGGATKYASQIIENKGDLKSTGITPEISRELLKGFAADVLLGNRDVLGNGDKPLSNVVIGHDGAVHRIDNGGALLFSGIGQSKPTAEKAELREWDGFSSSSTNGNYASVFAAAGVKNAESVAGIGQQIKAIKTLRDARGGWEGFIQHVAPDMPAAQRIETAKMLEARTALLEAKVKSVAGGNSLVGTRNFHYAGSTHEQTLIAHHKSNAPSLTPEEVDAVDAFKGGSYSAWNGNLRGSSTLTPLQEKRTKVLDAMFQKPGMVIGHDSALSRKMTITDAGELSKLAALAPGAVLAHTPVFQSTTVNSGIWHGNVHLCILAPAETPAVTPKAYTSTNAGEKEVLLPRGISYRVVSVSGPADTPPDGAPANWQWQSGATKIIVEAIVPGVNDMEHDGVPTHIISAADMEKKSSTILQNHAKAPLPNLSDLPETTLPKWAPKVSATASPSTAPSSTKPKKKKAAAVASAVASSAWSAP